jgi:hypothetical protein
VRQEEISYVAENGGFIVDQSQEVFAVEASVIQLLQEKWNVKGDETVAFGNVSNDIERLQHVKYGLLWKNSQPYSTI